MENYGESRERAHRHQRLFILALATVLSCLAPVVLVVAGEQNVIFPHSLGPGWNLPFVLRLAIFIVFVGSASLVARWNWIGSDEVRRGRLLSFWAAIGWSLSAVFVVFLLFGRDIPEAARLPTAFFAPMGMGAVFAVLQWRRDGFVW